MMDSNDIYRNQVKENNEFSSWAGRTRASAQEGEVRITDLNVPPDLVKGLELETKEELPPADRQQRIIRYIYSSPGEAGRQRLILTVFACNSLSDAHETLIDVVMTYMAPKLLRCESKGLEIGDICFGGYGEVNLSVIFARFNILAEIKSVGPAPTPVDEYARSLDSLILSQSRSTSGA